MESSLFSKHPEWQTVRFIIERLEHHGHQAVLAGGCVRDALLGRMAKDLDVATTATPDQIEEYFERVLPIGKSFGVCRVVHGGHSIEVATFRQECDYRDGRRPTKVEYSTLEKDAERRDFTINALYYDIGDDRVIDLVHGEADLQKKCIRAVGEPERRLNEDYLRILRGVRFAGHLGFSIESQTLKALVQLAVFLPRISRERIYDELNKMFESPARDRCGRLLIDLGILEILFPDWDLNENIHVIDQQVSLRTAFDRLAVWPKAESILVWTALYHLRLQQKEPRAVIKEFSECKIPRATAEASQSIVEAQEFLITTGDAQLKAFIALVATGNLSYAEAYWDCMSLSPRFSEESEKFKKMFFVGDQLPPPLVTGHDLIKKGFPQNAQMRGQLQSIYLDQLKRNEQNKERLLELFLSKRR